MREEALKESMSSIANWIAVACDTHPHHKCEQAKWIGHYFEIPTPTNANAGGYCHDR